MTLWEECADYIEEPMENDEASDLARELRMSARERSFHDRDGYLCEIAGSTECLALGHEFDPDEGWDFDGEHPVGWGGDNLCPATRYATACSYCESEGCDNPPLDPDEFWALFRSAA